jgi:hypothetical protein
MIFTHWLELNIPPLLLCGMIVVFAVGLALGGIFMIQRFFHYRKLKVHNDISGPIFGTLGGIYAVLLAFVVIVTWERFERVRLNSEQEVNCLANIYIISEPFEDSFRDSVRKGLGIYTREIIKEWDILAKGGANPQGLKELDNLMLLFEKYHPRNDTEKILLEKAIDRGSELLNLRLLRFFEGRIGIHPLLWFILIAGAVITITFTAFFGSEVLYAKIWLSILLAMIIALVLFTVLEFSLPFGGAASISVEQFKVLILRLGL